MRIALISDIHANLEALEAVMADIDSQNVDKILCLGDIIGYGADPNACLELVSSRCSSILMGNHEHSVLGLLEFENLNDVAKKSLQWTREQLSDSEISLLNSFETELVVDKLHLVHSSPYQPLKWHYLLSDGVVREAMKHMKTNLCVVGHTHLPVIYAMTNSGDIRKRTGHSFLPDPRSPRENLSQEKPHRLRTPHPAVHYRSRFFAQRDRK